MTYRRIILLVVVLLSIACKEPPASTPSAAAGNCEDAKNTCPDYSGFWLSQCPAGSRCITFTNSCTDSVYLAYNIGCDGDGKGGAPQCACTTGPTLASGGSIYWQITDGDYTSCLPSWKPPCLTAGLAVLVNSGAASCTTGTRVEFSAGNSADPYGKFDSYNLDIQKEWFSLPVKLSPNITCAVDHQSHDCRPLWCGDASCPDAYATPTNGGCADGRSPQAGCQDTFNQSKGYTVEYCPAGCTAAACPSCQDAKACP